MKQPPRNLRTPMFTKKTMLINVLQGLGVLLVTFVLFTLVSRAGKGEEEARTFAFAALVLSNLLLICTNVSWEKSLHHILLSANRTLVAVSVGTLLALLAVVYVPFLSQLFHLTALHGDDFLYILAAAVLSLSWFELAKLYRPQANRLYDRIFIR
jgi:Ca2+-transporting ATPase